MNNNLPDIILERYILGELPEEQLSEIKARAEKDPRLRKRITALRQSSREILDSYPAEDMAAAVRKRYSRIYSVKSMTPVEKKRKRLFFIVPASALGIGVTAVLLFFPGINPFSIQKNHRETAATVQKHTKAGAVLLRNKNEMIIAKNTIRLKGFKTDLYVYRKRKKVIEIMKNGSSARENDLIQVAYSAGKKSYGLIFSIDGRGSLTVHMPVQGKAAAPLQVGRKIFLSTAFQLDDAPGFERFFFITSRKKFNVASVLEKAKSLAASPLKAKYLNLALDNSFQQKTLLLVKGDK